MPRYEIDWDAINSIPIRDVLTHFNYKFSQDGSRFRCKYKKRWNVDGSIDDAKNVWRCHRCQTGGGTLQLVLHALGKPNNDKTRVEAAIYLGELFNTGLTVVKEQGFDEEQESNPLPSLHINRNLLDLIGIKKNPLLPIFVQGDVFLPSAKEYESDDAMFEDYDLAQRYCAMTERNFEISKSTAVNLLLNHCHNALLTLDANMEQCLTIIGEDPKEKRKAVREFKDKQKQVLDLIDRLNDIYERVVPDEEKIQKQLYEDYSEVFQ